jgi:hypothetical protein
MTFTDEMRQAEQAQQPPPVVAARDAVESDWASAQVAAERSAIDRGPEARRSATPNAAATTTRYSFHCYRRTAHINERLQLRKARAAALWLTLGRRGAVGGEGVSQGLLDRCGVHAEGVGDLAAVDDEGFLELVLHLR